MKECDRTSPRDANVANARLSWPVAFSRMSRPLHPFALLHRGARSRTAARTEAAAVWQAAARSCCARGGAAAAAAAVDKPTRGRLALLNHLVTMSHVWQLKILR